MRSVMEFFMADLAFELKKNERRFLPQNLLFKIAPFWIFQNLWTKVGYKNGTKWVTKMYCFGLQKWNGLGYKNSKNRYPQNRLTSVECILDMSPKNIQNGKCISLYNHRIYSLVCRYKTHEASHGSSRGWPHILVQWGFHLPVAVRILMSFDTVQKTYW